LCTRWILLVVVDGLLGGLVGFAAMLFSRHRQRIGDRCARTFVVRAAAQPMSAPSGYSPR
jgi:uncharacterized RDD family membrane protein YckC